MNRKKNRRRIRALERLQHRIFSRILSPEFKNKIEELSSDEKEKEIKRYWQLKEKEAKNLESNISTY